MDQGVAELANQKNESMPEEDARGDEITATLAAGATIDRDAVKAAVEEILGEIPRLRVFMDRCRGGLLLFLEPLSTLVKLQGSESIKLVVHYSQSLRV